MDCRTPVTESVILDEMYYKDIMRKAIPGWLPHKDYAHLIKYVKFQQMIGNTMKFFVPNHYNGWLTYIRFDQWEEQIRDMSLNAPEVARLLFWGADIRLHCGCPSYLFHGYQYIDTQFDAAIVPETRFPHIRNPNLKNFACKHLRRTLAVLPFHLGSIASAVKVQRLALKLS